MAIVQSRSKRKVSGGIYQKSRAKKKNELGHNPVHTKLGKTKSKKQNALGNTKKIKLLNAQYVNVSDPKTKKVKKVKIKGVLENPANKHYVRRHILTKGTVIDTELGKARITSRPGQQGIVNAVLC